MNKYDAIKASAYEANMLLPKLGLVLFTFGNVSAADHYKGVFAIKPSGIPYAELTEDMMVVVDFEGRVAEGRLRPSSDTPTHAELYKHWSGVSGICHTHSTYATAWAQAGRAIPLYGTTHADHSAQDIPCSDPMVEEQINSAYEKQTALQLINCLEENDTNYLHIEMILAGGHGPFTWGKTAGQAVHNAAVLENIAHMALLTEQISPGCDRLKPALIQKHYNRKHGPQAYYGQQDK